MMERVISGGQTGADQAGLAAAKACGIPTGGWMPKGFLTTAGPAPELAAEFGLKEHSGEYAERTGANVRDADATIRFAVDNWTAPLKQSELNTTSAYNTRTRKGLPPGPIGNPGLASIKAALKPANVDYLYYVVKPCGEGAHAFSSTDAQFQKDVAAYNKAREEKGGNDPSNC